MDYTGNFKLEKPVLANRQILTAGRIAWTNIVQVIILTAVIAGIAAPYASTSTAAAIVAGVAVSVSIVGNYILHTRFTASKTV